PDLHLGGPRVRLHPTRYSIPASSLFHRELPRAGKSVDCGREIERPSLRSFESDLPNTSRRKNGERRPNPRKGRIQWQERTLHKQNVSYWFSPRADCTKRQMWGPNQKSSPSGSGVTLQRATAVS